MEDDLRKKLSHLPDKPGAYMMKDKRGEVIYVGKAASLRSRVRSYFQKGQVYAARVHTMIENIADVEWLVTDSEVEALMLECNLIKKHRPRYNVRLRDDKHYPYLCVTTVELFPRVLVVRRVKQDGSKYFGPYTDSSALRESLRLIRKVFRIRSCNKKLTGTEHDRPCLNFHLDQCQSPCSGRINGREYADLVKHTCLFLEGRQEPLAKQLEKEMLAAAEGLEFERAARFRDQLQSMRRLAERQTIIGTDDVDRDVIGIAEANGIACVQVLFVRSGKLVGQDHFFMGGVTDERSEESLHEFVKQYYRDATYIPKEILTSREPVERDILENWLSVKREGRVRIVTPRRGSKHHLAEMASANAAIAAQCELGRQDDESKRSENLEHLRAALGLPAAPHRIEAYDISNIHGREAVGSMIVFEGNRPAKHGYRRFKIRTVDQPDDCAMLHELLKRRLRQAKAGDPKFSTLPDLILVDGGSGQLNAAEQALSEEGYHIPTRALAKRLEEVHAPESAEPLVLPRNSTALRLLQRIRDEAHRFALSYHHRLRDKAVRKSVLDDIPGVGEQRRKALIRRFGSVAGIRAASLDDLLEVPGIPKSVAEAVYDSLQRD